MSWDAYDQQYWEIEGHVSLADAPLARVFRALIQCDGRVYRTACMQKKMGSSELQYANRYCGAQLIISLPVGAREEFEKLSKCGLVEPKRVQTN